MSGTFELKQTSDAEFIFNLKAGNGEIILTSERYTSKQSAQQGIESVKKNASKNENFKYLTSKSGEPYFVLEADNGEVIGKSEMYSSETSRDEGIGSVQNNAPHAQLTT